MMGELVNPQMLGTGTLGFLSCFLVLVSILSEGSQVSR